MREIKPKTHNSIEEMRSDHPMTFLSNFMSMCRILTKILSRLETKVRYCLLNS